jgi:beta-glucosidase
LKVKARYTFPQGFLWGSATSSHQVEGDNHLNDWWQWETEAGRIVEGHRSGKACDWWAGRWQEDLDRAAADGQNAHRLSIEWSRIEPAQALWDEGAIETYRQILEGIRQRGMEPMVTLHHFTNPLWVMQQGGWIQPQIVTWFERYVRKIARSLHDQVDLWVTINEPNVYLLGAYIEGSFPPGGVRLTQAPTVAKHLLEAHARAYHAIHEIQPEASVGISHHYRGFVPRNPRSIWDRWAARVRHQSFNQAFSRGASSGELRFLTSRQQIPEAADTQDFIGLNYYTLERCSFNPLRPQSLFEIGNFPPEADVSPGGYIANEPQGMWSALQWANQFNLPIYVTENGVEDDQDEFRRRYLALHLKKVWLAANFNWQVKGYFHWSLVDNFEWERGWTQKFGLWALDEKTQKRTRRLSAEMYAQICQANSLDASTVAEFAPETLETLFPSPGPSTLGTIRT